MLINSARACGGPKTHDGLVASVFLRVLRLFYSQRQNTYKTRIAYFITECDVRSKSDLFDETH